MLEGRMSRVVFWHGAVFFLVVPVASFAMLALLRYARHRCPHYDPLCKRNRPSIGCYRELFNSVKT